VVFFFLHFITGDSLTYNNNMKFTTKNQDNDQYDSFNCGIQEHGGWWYKHCSIANLNGQYQPGVSNRHSVYWYHFRGSSYSLKRAQMMMRKN